MRRCTAATSLDTEAVGVPIYSKLDVIPRLVHFNSILGTVGYDAGKRQAYWDETEISNTCWRGWEVFVIHFDGYSAL